MLRGNKNLGAYSVDLRILLLLIAKNVFTEDTVLC